MSSESSKITSEDVTNLLISWGNVLATNNKLMEIITEIYHDETHVKEILYKNLEVFKVLSKALDQTNDDCGKWISIYKECTKGIKSELEDTSTAGKRHTND